MAKRPAEVALVCRQPIYDRGRKLFAYELLYRNQFGTSANSSGDASTAEVFRNTFLEIGLDRLAGENRVFVNLTRSFILGDYCFALPQDRVVLEVLEDVAPDSDVVQALSRLAAQGYKIALDDFIYSEEKLPLLELADYIKVDFRAQPLQAITRMMTHIKPFRAHLLAEKVETYDEFDAALAAGFDFFQGYFFCQPRILKASRIPLNRLSTLQILAHLKDGDARTSDLEQLIQQDIAMSYSLLRYVNSAAVSLSRPVESVSHAIQMVGRRQIRIWASLLLLSTFEDKPRELTVTALIRAGMAERLATQMGITKTSSSYFTVGLFSVVDALLDRPMTDALQLLPFNEEIRGALVGKEGQMGTVLRCVLAYEAGNWDEAVCGTLTPEVIRDCYVAAVAAASELAKAT